MGHKEGKNDKEESEKKKETIKVFLMKIKWPTAKSNYHIIFLITSLSRKLL